MVDNETPQHEGEIVRLTEKGFGFLKVEGFTVNVFFHAKNLRRVRFEQLREGDRVTIGEIYQKNRVDGRSGEEVEGYCASTVMLAS